MADSDGRSRDGRDGDREEWDVDPDDYGSAGGDRPDDPDDEGWRFSLDDVGEDGVVRPSIEPGTPDPENALFVVLGAIAMVVVCYQLWVLLT